MPLIVAKLAGVGALSVFLFDSEDIDIAIAVLFKGFVIKEGELDVKVAALVIVFCGRVEMLAASKDIVNDIYLVREGCPEV